MPCGGAIRRPGQQGATPLLGHRLRSAPCQRHACRLQVRRWNTPPAYCTYVPTGGVGSRGGAPGTGAGAPREESCHRAMERWSSQVRQRTIAVERRKSVTNKHRNHGTRFGHREDQPVVTSARRSVAPSSSGTGVIVS
jgi:hypothetical protein